MSGSIKVSGTFKEVAPYVKVGGIWKFAPEAWTKVSGSWKKWFLAGGLNDSEFNTADNYDTLDATVFAVAVQADGKIILGGFFVTFNGATVNYIVRLNSDGTHDTAFTTNTGTGANSYVRTIAIQSDGKILLGGNFTTFNGATVLRFVRLNSDGTRDTAFTANTGVVNSIPYAIAIQSDGKIVVGGDFTTFNGVSGNRLVRLNSDGTRDSAFTTAMGSGVSNNVRTVAIQSDGKILVGGAFTAFNGSNVPRIVRLNSDGTRDTAFTTNTGTSANSNVRTIAIQSDGKIVVGGDFTTFNGATVNRIIRLSSAGVRETSFTTNIGTGPNSDVYRIAIQTDGKILLCGQFSGFNGVSVNFIVRLNSDGTRDTAFTANTGTGASPGATEAIVVKSDGKILLVGVHKRFNGIRVNHIAQLDSDGSLIPYGTINGSNYTINTIAVQSDGKILLGGGFTVFNSINTDHIVRLNTDGSVDTAFTANIGTGFDGNTGAIAIQPDGKIVVGGYFTTFNGVANYNIARLNSDGTLDTAFTSNVGSGFDSLTYAIAVQPDGKIIVGGPFTTFNGVTVNTIVRLNSDGTLDTGFLSNTGSGSDYTITAIGIQSDGKIILGGYFFMFNGTFVNGIVRLNSDGTLDTSFLSNTGTGVDGDVNDIKFQSDGKILLGGNFSNYNGTMTSFIRLNSDGTEDTAFTTNMGSGVDSSVYGIAIQADGKIVLVGIFSSFNGANTTKIVRLNSNGTRDAAFTTNTGAGTVVEYPSVYAVALQPDGKIIVGGDFLNWNSIVRHSVARFGGDQAS